MPCRCCTNCRHLPVAVDPSHGTGYADLVHAHGAGLGGGGRGCHHGGDPSRAEAKATSDGAQTINAPQFAQDDERVARGGAGDRTGYLIGTMKRIAILGLGLMGGSLGLAIKARRLGWHVAGYTRTAARGRRALQAGRGGFPACHAGGGGGGGRSGGVVRAGAGPGRAGR
jgi:hypothetical protein